MDAYLLALANADPSGEPEAGQIAFWLNAYNAVIVAGVLEGYSPETFFGRARFFRFYRRRIAGEERTPEAIEHEILRRRFDEPRIHFALVCASTSCPRLRREAYDGQRLETQLDDQARTFLGDPSRNRLEGSRLELSMIFDWFADDFAKAAGSVVDYLRRYRPIEGDPDVEYLEYDWTLNAQPGQRPAT